MGENFATSPIAPKPMQGNLAPQPDAEVGEELVVDEGSQQEPETLTFAHAPSFWDSNIHNQARIEGANTPADFYTINQNGDGFAFTGYSTGDTLKPSIESCVNHMLELDGADRRKNVLVEDYDTGASLEVPGVTLRKIRMNQDKYPEFLVLGKPIFVKVVDEKSGMIKHEQRFALHITYKPTGEVLKGDNQIKFLQNIVQPALMKQEEDGITEIAS